MLKSFIASFFLLLVAAPALAQQRDVYPVSCDDLWAAVHDTLDNPHNYGILSMNDVERRASFTVVGNLTAYTDRVALTAKGSGCAMTAAFLEVGPDNSDYLQFHHRLARSLAKLQAGKPKPAVTPAGRKSNGRVSAFRRI
jgi:hypothetical protein